LHRSLARGGLQEIRMLKYLGLGAIVALSSLAPFVVTPLFAADTAHTLDLVERVSKFTAFYQEAQGTNPDARWTLWQKDYGYAAVPPGPDGEKMARAGLDAAWDKYPALIAQLPQLQKNSEDTARLAFERVNALYKTDATPIHTRVVLFVGQFDDNAYSIPSMNGSVPTVMMEVEDRMMATTLTHEIAHTIHFQLAGVKNSFGGRIGEMMFLEGLAMHTAEQVLPGRPESDYVGDPKWLANCYAKKGAVLADILPDLEKSGREVAMKYTFGQGNNGMQREAYCAAWIVMGKILKSGRSFPELARVPEDQMVATIKAAMTN
jgi:hypothetical protein